MTSFDDIAQQSFKTALTRKSFRQDKPGGPATTMWQDTLHVLGKPEEIITKIVGQTLTDDRKYDSAFGSSDFWNQVGFYELIKDAGVNQDNLGSAGPAMAALLGVGAAIANPLDPLNKIKIGALTKAGVAGKAVANAIATGEDALELVEAAGKSYQRISPVEVAKSVANAEKIAASGATQVVRRHAQQTAKQGNQKLSEIEELNKVLKDLQLKAGLSIDDIKLADTTYNQIRNGQRHLFGFSSPRRLDQLSLLGVHSDGLSGASVIGSPALGSAALVDAAGKVGRSVKGIALEAGRTVADKMGFQVIRNQRLREAQTRIKQIIQAATGNSQLYLHELENLRVSLGLSKEDLIGVVNQLEDGLIEHKRVMTDLIENRITNSPDPLVFKAGKAVREGEPEVAGSRLSPEQELLLTPSGIDDANDVPRVLDQFDRAEASGYPAWEVSGGSLRTTGDFVVMRPSSPKAEVADFNSLNTMLGVRAYKKVERAGETLLVARKLAGGVPVTEASMFGPEHLDNLQVLLAGLAKQKKSLADLTAGDILINPLGGVQIVNPAAVTEFTSATHALTQARGVLDKFLDSETLVPRGSIREFHHLKTLKAARRAPKSVRARAIQTDTPSMNVHDLLEEAVNVAPERDFVRGASEGLGPRDIAGITQDPRDFARANNIQAEVDKMLESIRKGETLNIEPIVVTRDSGGALYVTHGHERLAAARMLDIDVVPIRVNEGIGDTLDMSRGFYVGKTLKVDQAFAAEGATVFDTATDPAKHSLSSHYKAVLDDGSPLVVHGAHMATPSHQNVLLALGELSTVGVIEGPGKKARPGLLITALRRKFGSDGAAAASISDLVNQSTTPQELTSKLHELVGTLSNSSAISKPVNQAQAVEAYSRIVEAAGQNLEELARQGFLTTSVVHIPEFQDLAAQGRRLQILDKDSNTLRYVCTDCDAPTTRNFAEASLNKLGGAAEIDPNANITTRSRDGESTVRAADLVVGEHPKLAQAINQRAGFQLSDAERQRWKDDLGVFALTSDSADDIPSVVRGFNVRRGDTDSVARLPFVVTRSGEIFVSTKHQDAGDMVGAMFGNGPNFAQEFGVVAPGSIIVNDPLGALMPRVGKAEIRALQNRIAQLAGRFEDAGFAPGNAFDVRTPFEIAVWQEMYPRGTRISDVTKRGWKLEVPELLDGMPLDLDLAQTSRVVSVNAPRFANQRQQQLFDFLRESFDAQFVEEALASVNTSFWASYFPRFLTREAKAAFDKAGFDYMKANPKLLAHVEGFVKKRTLTDMTLTEVNDMFTSIREAVRKGNLDADADSTISGIVDLVKNDYRKTLDSDTARQYARIADGLPDGAKFFHDDPLWAAHLRFDAGQRAVSRKAIVDELKSAGAVWTGTPAQAKALSGTHAETVGKLESELADLKARRGTLESELASLPDTPELTSVRRNKLQELLDENEAAIGVKHMEIGDAQATYVGANGIAATNVDLTNKRVFVGGDDAARLVETGVIDPSDLPDGMASPLVEIPFDKYSSVLDSNGVEVILFNREAAGIAERFFGMQKKDGFTQFLKFWDEAHNLWRTWTLFPVPAYHFRNAFSNAFMAYLGGVNNSASIEASLRLMKILRQKRSGAVTLAESKEMLQGLRYASVAGQTADADTMLSEFVRRGGFAGGHFQNEFSNFGSLRRASDFARKSAEMGLIPVSEAAGSFRYDNKAIRLGLRVGTTQESHFRMAAFIDEWTKTGSFDAAERKMKAVFYDYSDLNAFERNVLRRVIPFYSWARHNIPAMLKTMVLDPQKHLRTVRAIHQIEQGALDGVPRDEEGIPEYVRDNYGIVLQQTKDGKYFMKAAEGLFPMFDVYSMLSKGPLDPLAKGVTPFLKAPIEQLTNHSFFTGQDIERISGEPSRRLALSSMGFTRRATTAGELGPLNLLLNESVFRDFLRVGTTAANLFDDLLDKRNWIDGDPSVAVAAWDLFLGRGMVIDPEVTRAIVASKHRSMMRKLDGIARYYRENGWTSQENRINQMKMNYTLQFGGKL